MNDRSVVYLKLGGSLITDKRSPEAPRLEVIRRIAAEIGAARRRRPNMTLVLGHGSGSFGHVHAHRFGTRDGVRSLDQWNGFALTADAALRLTRIVCAALLEEDLPVWSIQPSAGLRCEDGHIVAGPQDTVLAAIERGLIPLLHGDVALDSVRGGTIASTEEIFEWMLTFLPARRIVLAGEVDGVYSADPNLDRTASLFKVITPRSLVSSSTGMGPSDGTDVTGGMQAKVEKALRMVRNNPGLEIVISGGLHAGQVEEALCSASAPGTTIRAGAD